MSVLCSLQRLWQAFYTFHPYSILSHESKSQTRVFRSIFRIRVGRFPCKIARRELYGGPQLTGDSSLCHSGLCRNSSC